MTSGPTIDRSREPNSDSRTSASVAYGRVSSVARTSVRSRRARGARGALRVFCLLGFGSETVPSRSIFGARLRRRVPQYGHSVIYGLTSEPQFLQTTKRSGELAIYPPMIGGAGGAVGGMRRALRSRRRRSRRRPRNRRRRS